MFTQKEVNSIDLEYFCIIQLGGYAVTIKSKNTRHCWHIVSQSYKTHSSCQVYHTHQENTPYHRHGNAGSLQAAIRMIQNHDEYLLHKIQNKKGRN